MLITMVHFELVEVEGVLIVSLDALSIQDEAASEVLYYELIDLINEGNVKLRINFRNVKFVCSSALSCFIKVKRCVEERGGQDSRYMGGWQGSSGYGEVGGVNGEE